MANHVVPTARKQLIKGTPSLALNVDNILRQVNEGTPMVLVLHELLAPFDTVDHQIICQWLASAAGLDGQALAWLQSFLKDRTQKVKV